LPKQVDHQQRRQRIADAVRRLVAAHGLGDVSLRHVADEAGVSMGQVQHYFATKDEMLLFAFRALAERVEARIGAAAPSVGESPSEKQVLAALLREMLPISEQAQAEAPVWIAFLARAVIAPELAASVQDGGELHRFVAERIRSARHADNASPDVDAQTEARSLLALVDGMMIHMLVGQLDADDAVATLDYHLARIFNASTHAD
jgi:AcrR family transcriptional regulator